MENATKAMLIAAGVLIGLMVISLGVSLYVSLSDYVETTQEELAMTEIRKFNQQFTKYSDYNTLTIQDIVTAANIAYENNLYYGLSEYKEGNYYVTVKLDGAILEKTIVSETTKILQNGFGKQYKCDSTNIKISQITGRVYEVNFSTL